MKDYLLLWQYRINQFGRLCYFSVKNWCRIIKNFFVKHYTAANYYVTEYLQVKELHKYFRYRIYSTTLYKFIEKEKNVVDLLNFKKFCIENDYLQNKFFEIWLTKNFIKLNTVSLAELQITLDKASRSYYEFTGKRHIENSKLEADALEDSIEIYNSAFTYNIELLRAEILDKCLTALGNDLTTKYLNTIIEKITQVYLSVNDFTEQLHERVLNNTEVMCELIKQHEQNFYKSYRPDLNDGNDSLGSYLLEKIAKTLQLKQKNLDLENFYLLQSKEN